ncbi:MAG: 2Fe-2S iron-sulfur cluster-binding protein [Thermoanaerobaculia bacterium]
MAKDGKREDPPAGGLSRRDFLRGGAVAGALGSAGLLGSELVEGAKGAPAPRMEAGVEVFGPGPVPMRLRINGKNYDLRLEPRTTLLDALREELELTGAKRVCDRGTCGACTVLVDGKAVYACSQLAIDVQRQPIDTLEGLGRPEKLHPLQAAFVDNDAQQCGFCTPGFVMAAKALLDHTPNPTLRDVHHGLSGNFCRCGTYAGMRRAVLAAAPLMAGAAAVEPEEGAEVEDVDVVAPPGDKPGDKKSRRKKRKGGGHHG